MTREEMWNVDEADGDTSRQLPGVVLLVSVDNKDTLLNAIGEKYPQFGLVQVSNMDDARRIYEDLSSRKMLFAIIVEICDVPPSQIMPAITGKSGSAYEGVPFVFYTDLAKEKRRTDFWASFDRTVKTREKYLTAA